MTRKIDIVIRSYLDRPPILRFWSGDGRLLLQVNDAEYAYTVLRERFEEDSRLMLGRKDENK